MPLGEELENLWNYPLNQTNYYVDAIGTSLNTRRFSTDGSLAGLGMDNRI